MVVLVMTAVLILYRKIFASNLLIFLTVFLCTLVYENLGILLICSLFFTSKGSEFRLKKILVAISGVVLSWATIIFGLVLKNGAMVMNESDGRYLELNLEYWWKILGAMIILLTWGFTLGIFVGLSRFRKSALDHNSVILDLIDTKIYHGIFLGYVISFIVGFFVSGLVEFARQFLFLQILIFFYGFSFATRLRKRFKHSF